MKQKDNQIGNSTRIKTGFKFVVRIKHLLIILPGTAAAEKTPDYVSELEKSFSHALWAASMYHLFSVCRVKSASRPFPKGWHHSITWEKIRSWRIKTLAFTGRPFRINPLFGEKKKIKNF